MSNEFKAELSDTPQRAPYERPVVIELNLAEGTYGKINAFSVESGTTYGPS